MKKQHRHRHATSVHEEWLANGAELMKCWCGRIWIRNIGALATAYARLVDPK